MHPQTSTTGKKARQNNKFLLAVPVIIVFYSEIFFGVHALLGLNHEGGDGNTLYMGYIAAVVIVGIGFALPGIFSRGLAVNYFFMLLLPIAVLILFLLDFASDGVEAHSWDALVFWLTIPFPAFLVGMAATKRNQLTHASLILEPIMLLFSAASVIYALNNLTAGLQATGLGGATYQTASYVSALAFGINLYHLFFGRNHTRWAYTRTKPYLFLSFLLLPLQAASCLLAGGRGGFLLLIIYSLTLSIVAAFHRGRSRLGQGLLSLALLSLITYCAVPSILSSELGARRIDRVFAYLGTGGINWEGTSGRDMVYRDAWDAVQASPIFGYGAFSWEIGTYPHNFFLEILLNGGILYLMVWLTALIYIMFRIATCSKEEPATLILLVIGLFALTMLMFSGSYWLSTSLWYFIGAGLTLTVANPKKRCLPRSRVPHTERYT